MTVNTVIRNEILTEGQCEIVVFDDSEISIFDRYEINAASVKPHL